MKLRTRSLLAIVMLSLSQPLLAEVSVNGKAINQSLIDHINKEAAENGQKDPNFGRMVVDRLVANEIIYQEAVKIGINRQPDYVAREELARRELMMNLYVQDFVSKNPVTDAEVKAAYDKFKAEQSGKEYSARHILLGTEAEAKDVIAQLGKGADFAKLASEKSKDPGSKVKGGDLGWFSPAAMVKPFSEAASKLTKGSFTKTPVQTQYGWHVIKLENVRDAQIPTLDSVKDRLTKQLQQRKLESKITELRNKAKIVDSSAKK